LYTFFKETASHMFSAK